MRQFAILWTVVGIFLSGCKSEQISNLNENSNQRSKPQTSLSMVTAPNGRWFSNPLHCSGKLPISGTYDFSVAGNSLTYVGITDNGSWKDDSQNEQARKAFNDLLAAESKCLANASIADFQMVKFIGKNTEYWFAYSAKNNLLLRYNAGYVDIIVPFEVDKIKQLQLEDSTEGPMQLENVSPAIAPVGVETSDTASH